MPFVHTLLAALPAQAAPEAAVAAPPEGGISPGWQITIYCLAVGIASLAGGALAANLKLSHRRLQFALSFVGGTMLGVGVLHLLPHAIIIALESKAAGEGAMSHGALHASLDGVVLAVVLGFMSMFLLERFFHFHQHESPEHAGHHDCCDDGCDAHAAGQGAGHGHGHAHAHGRKPRKMNELGWIGAAVGLTLHSILEGVALSAAVLAAAAHGDTGVIAGLSTFVVILLHKPFDGLTITTLVRAAGRPAGFAHAVNAVFALVVPVGAAMLWLGVSQNGAEILPYALAFSAGTFICIATSDLLPELQFHRHDRVGLSAALLVGLALAATIARIESAVAQSHDHAHHDHAHDHDHSHGLINPTKPAPADAHDHDHSDPNHKH
jgi:zinc and cadmium transporter